MKLAPIVQTSFFNAESNQRPLAEAEHELSAKMIPLSEVANYAGNHPIEQGLVEAFHKLVSCLPPEQPLNDRTAWTLWPLVRSEDEKTRNLACKVLKQHHHDLRVRLAGGEERFMSSVLLGVKHPTYMQHALELASKAENATVDLTDISAEGLDALQQVWEGVPLAKVIANDSGGRVLSEFIRAAALFGSKELITPQYLCEAIQDAYVSKTTLTIYGQEQIELESGLSSDAEVEEVRHLNRLFAIAGVRPKHTFFAGSPDFSANLSLLLREEGLITKLTIKEGDADDGPELVTFGFMFDESSEAEDLEGISSIGAEVIKAIGAALENNRTLQEFSVKGLPIGDEGAKAIAAVLEKNGVLQKLDLLGHDIGNEGARAIGAALQKNRSLLRLCLSFNSIGDEGAIAIGEGLEKNRALQHLSLGNNSIGDEGAMALGKGVESNGVLRNLGLSGNVIRYEGAKALGAALEKNSALQWLIFSGNPIGDEGAIAMAAALEKNKSLQGLFLRGNFIGDEGAMALGAAFANNSTLQEFALGNNVMGEECKAFLTGIKNADNATICLL